MSKSALQPQEKQRNLQMEIELENEMEIIIAFFVSNISLLFSLNKFLLLRFMRLLNEQRAHYNVILTLSLKFETGN